MAGCPKPLVKEALRWTIAPAAAAVLSRFIRDDLDLKGFRESLGQLLCHYYNATAGLKKASNVSPIWCGVTGGKGFKVRWTYAGQGKSGGLRLGVLALCDKARVVIAYAEVRSQEPPIENFEKAFKAAETE